ncbi:hypothetical protein [Weeksella sp. HMSC059D05]|uniref:hypothetical protein n=1 Tax=Weeksella sp. HMSC059D05 TaxID=1715139 RepID=UPI0008A3B854|nr:hypothetical protein [Weeksella sp. HMSC059D05]OFM82242.1 hypothetical protein HMPREF2660_04675 [Weeksella sp. HMSC059D05]
MRILGLSKARHLLEGFFYTNLYLIFIVWSLSWESIQLQKLPQNSILFYLLSASATFLFYLYAYRKDTKTLNQNNLRSVYFYNHPKTILFLVNLFRFIFLVIAIYLLLNHPINTKIIFSFPFWVAIATILFALVFYDNRLGISLRKNTFIKPFFIGWSWAIVTVLLPYLCLVWQNKVATLPKIIIYGVFFHTFLFCSINAIIFDLKDYEEDAHVQLQTFVVKYGYLQTLSRVILPLLIIDSVLVGSFSVLEKFSILQTLILQIPILLMTVLVFVLRKQKSLLFFLVIVDGVLFLKAIIGILVSNV